jgi:hypothetical protein
VFFFVQLYCYRKESLNSNKNKINLSLTNQTIETTSTIIEELMRKSLELAKTAEKVADNKEKQISLQEKI